MLVVVRVVILISWLVVIAMVALMAYKKDKKKEISLQYGSGIGDKIPTSAMASEPRAHEGISTPLVLPTIGSLPLTPDEDG